MKDDYSPPIRCRQDRGRAMTDVAWTTRLDPFLTAKYGVAELHSVAFEPLQWNADHVVAVLGLPECELCIATRGDDPLVVINRPSANPNIKYWTKYACALATDKMAFLSFTCDTAEQAEQAAKRAVKLLPRHQRIALERVYDVAARERASCHDRAGACLSAPPPRPPLGSAISGSGFGSVRSSCRWKLMRQSSTS
jgi:hypothetical protein